MNMLFKIDESASPDISGLTYIPDFITREEEQSLLNNIDSSPWLNNLKRRVQHYGYKYDYRARTVNDDAHLGLLPEWAMPLSQRFFKKGIFSAVPDQVIINEYEPGQGISAHIDCVPCFDGTIASLSLGSSYVMEFSNVRTQEKKEILLEELIIIRIYHRYSPWFAAATGC
jgi:alkylated DNA repair dioxygenase AlkB